MSELIAPPREEPITGAPFSSRAVLDPEGSSSQEAQPIVRVIEPRSGWRLSDVGELWQFRELLFFLTWRDVKVRYKQTALGAAWAILQPLATMLVFSVFFGRVASSRDESAVAYPLFVLAGVIPWSFLANAFSAAGQSVVGNERLVTKIYFPRLIIPLSTIGAGLVDFAIASVLLIPMMMWYWVVPTSGVLVLPLIVAMLVIAATGVGTLLCALTVAYRDFKHVVPFLTQFWMFATPAIYLQANDALGSQTQRWLSLNPAHGLIDNFRRCLLGSSLDWLSLITSSIVALILLGLGVTYFRKVERRFADII
jgi:lipopolysaccharide transport system permease protein